MCSRAVLRKQIEYYRQTHPFISLDISSGRPDITVHMKRLKREAITTLGSTYTYSVSYKIIIVLNLSCQSQMVAVQPGPHSDSGPGSSVPWLVLPELVCMYVAFT